MAERHVAMTFHFENPAGASQLVEARAQIRLNRDSGHASSGEVLGAGM
jgi:hypothetical protein